MKARVFSAYIKEVDDKYVAQDLFLVLLKYLKTCRHRVGI
jgi:hypothetical protein